MDSYEISSKKSKRPYVLFLVLIVALLFLLSYVFPESKPTVNKAVAVLKGDSPVTGTVTFYQSSKNAPVIVTGELMHMDPHAKRGFHIHQLGDATNGCASSGAHFNPGNKNHGAPSDTERHVGDLGNIETDGFGTAKFTIEDSVISLNGRDSIVGRTVVVHMGTDDLGKGGNDESLKTGNAGGRAACGVIGLAA